MHYKRLFLSSLLLALCIGLLLPGALVIAIDPFRIYHETYFDGAGYSNIQRYQHAGLINTYLGKDPQYDTVVTGSSTAANFYPEDIQSFLGYGKALNLSINGSTPIEQHTVTRRALSTGKVKLLLWDVHAEMFSQPADYLARSEVALPSYLYDDNLLNDAQYIFNIDNIKTGLAFYRGHFDNFNTPINRVGAWFQGAWEAGQFAEFSSGDYIVPDARKTLHDWQEAFRNTQMPDQADNAKRLFSPADFNYPSVEQNLLSLVLPLCNSDTRIELLFTPFSRMLFARIGSAHAIHKYLYMRRYLVKQTAHCKNIHVSAFDNEDWITADTSNYMDNFHYKDDINRYILESLATGKHRLTPGNIDAHENAFLNKVFHFTEQIAEQSRN